MSANVFTAFGPVGQGMGPVGGAALCGTDEFPLALTLLELVEWYWMTRYVNMSCSATASEGSASASFVGGIVGGPVQAFGNRQDLINNGTWNPQTGFIPQPSVLFQSASISLFNNYPCVAFDGTSYYPHIIVNGQIIIQDPLDLDKSTNIFWDSRITGAGYPNFGSATIFGKNVTVGWDVIQSATATGSYTFGPTVMTKDSDWPYT